MKVRASDRKSHAIIVRLSPTERTTLRRLTRPGDSASAVIRRLMNRAPLPITAEHANAANALIERHAPGGEKTTAVQIALGHLALWITTDGQYPKAPERSTTEEPHA